MGMGDGLQLVKKGESLGNVSNLVNEAMLVILS